MKRDLLAELYEGKGDEPLNEAEMERMKDITLLTLSEDRLRETRRNVTGPGIKSIITVHRKIVKDRTRNLRRKLEGRFVWP
jgi:hypothetical protein